MMLFFIAEFRFDCWAGLARIDRPLMRMICLGCTVLKLGIELSRYSFVFGLMVVSQQRCNIPVQFNTMVTVLSSGSRCEEVPGNGCGQEHTAGFMLPLCKTRTRNISKRFRHSIARHSNPS